MYNTDLSAMGVKALKDELNATYEALFSIDTTLMSVYKDASTDAASSLIESINILIQYQYEIKDRLNYLQKRP